MKDTKNVFTFKNSQNYASIIFEEKDYFRAIATAIYAESALYIWNKDVSKWDMLFSSFATDEENQLYLEKQEIRYEQFIKECSHEKCRYDCLFQKNDSYYYDGAGTIVLPERIIIDRFTLFDDKELPDCPLNEYDIHSDADYQELERLLHELPPYNPEEANPDAQNSEEEEEFSFCENPTFHRVYTYLPYTHWRLKQILNDYYGASMVCVRGYKEGRYTPNYKQRYNIYWNSSGKLAAKNIHLDTLRYIFAEKEFPLHEPDTNRNQGAVMFLNIIQQIKNQQKNI